MSLPKKLYVYSEKDGDSEYFMAFDNLDATASFAKRRLVGIYELKEKVTVRATSQIETKKVK